MNSVTITLLTASFFILLYVFRKPVAEAISNWSLGDTIECIIYIIISGLFEE